MNFFKIWKCSKDKTGEKWPQINQVSGSSARKLKWAMRYKENNQSVLVIYKDEAFKNKRQHT